MSRPTALVRLLARLRAAARGRVVVLLDDLQDAGADGGSDARGGR